MQIHHRGYVSGDPRIHEAAGHGIDRPADIPDAMDVLIVGLRRKLGDYGEWIETVRGVGYRMKAG